MVVVADGVDKRNVAKNFNSQLVCLFRFPFVPTPCSFAGLFPSIFMGYLTGLMPLLCRKVFSCSSG